MLGFVLYSSLISAFLGWVSVLSRVFPRSSCCSKEGKFFSSLILISAIHLIVLMRVPLILTVWGFMIGGNLCLLSLILRGTVKISDSLFWPSRLLVGFLVLMFLVKTVCEGISGWDARSIYFFHGKVIYFAEMFPIEPWKLQEYDFAHLDYPKLTASLAALISTGIGYWNEYWPKLATGSLLILLHCGIYVMPLKFIERFFIQLTMFSIPGYFLWVGEQDGYLAGFSFLAVLYLGWGLRYKKQLWVQIGMACLLLGMQIKNEGLVFGGIAFLAAFIFQPRLVFQSIASLSLVVVASPVFLWAFYRHYFGIRNDLSVGFSKQRILERIGSWDLFWHDFLSYFFLKTDMWRALFLTLLILGILRWLRKLKWDVGTWVAIVSYVGYCFALFCVYLSTYWDLVEHLKTSVVRVAFTPALVLLGGVILASPIQPSENAVVQQSEIEPSEI